MKSKCVVLEVILTCLIFMGCAQRMEQIIETPANTYTPTRIPTKTLVGATETSQLPSARTDIVDNCVAITDILPPNIEGKVAAIENGFDPILVDTLTGQKEYITGKADSLINVSPDFEKLAYLDVTSHQILVLNYDGKITQSIPAPETWRRVLGWVDNNRLLVENVRTISGESFRLSSTIAMDITNNMYQEYLPEYPDIMSPADHAVHWGKYSTTYTIYDPLLTKVLYPAQIESETPIVLWDIQKKEETGRIHSRGFYFSSSPQWNSGGTSFAVSAFPVFQKDDGTLVKNALDDLPYLGGTELFMVSRDGVVKRLTYLTTHKTVSMENYAWSPDGKLIAFWLTHKNDIARLAILDVGTGELMNLCIQGGDYGINSPVPPVWSPSGFQLAVTIPNPDKKRHPEIVLIDLKQNIAMKIAEDAEAMGWVVSTP